MKLWGHIFKIKCYSLGKKYSFNMQNVIWPSKISQLINSNPYACVPTLKRHHHFLVEIKWVICKLHRANVSLWSSGRIWASSCILWIYPVTFLDLSALRWCSLLLTGDQACWYGRDPHGSLGPSQSATHSSVPARQPDSSPHYIQNNMAGISPDGRARTALNWRSSATEVRSLDRLPYISLFSLRRKLKCGNEGFAFDSQGKGIHTQSWTLCSLSAEHCIKEECIFFFNTKCILTSLTSLVKCT